MVLRDSEKATPAFLYFNKAKDFFLQQGDSLMVGKCLVNMAFISTVQGDDFGSIELSLNALSYFEESDSDQRAYLLSNYNNLGMASYNLKRYSKAIEFYQKSIAFIHDSLDIRVVKNNIANAYRKEGNYTIAIERYQEILKKEDDSVNYARVLSNYAYTKWLHNPAYNAVSQLKKALNMRIAVGDVWGQNASYAHLADYNMKKQPDVALQYARSMYRVATELNSADDQLEALQKLIILSRQENTKDYFNHYQHLDDSLQTARSGAKNQFALIRYETEKHKADNLVLQQEKEERQRWIWCLLLLIGLGSIVTVIWSKKRKRHLQLEASNAIRESQLKTSKKVHDVVANGLYRIMSELENRGQLDRDKMLDDMEALYEQSRDISYEEDYLKMTAQEFQQVTNQLLTAFATPQIKVLIVGNTVDFWERVSKELRYEIKQVLQELLVNMKKHSQASQVAIRFELLEDSIKVHYADNGLGMPEEMVYGNGLRNTGNRIKEMGGHITFDKVSGGLKIQLQFPAA